MIKNHLTETVSIVLVVDGHRKQETFNKQQWESIFYTLLYDKNYSCRLELFTAE